MLPFIQLGPWSVSTYALIYSLAFVIGGSLAYHRLGRAVERPEVLRNSLLLTIPGILIGMLLLAWAEAGLGYLITGQPQTATIRVYYGLALAVVLARIYAHRLKISSRLLGDRVLPAFALGFAIARLGCLANGCCGGAETDAFWGMYTPDESGIWLMRHPTQLLSGLSELALFWGLSAFNAWRDQKPTHAPAWLLRDGLVSNSYFFCFGAERFLLEFLRSDFKPIWGPLSLPNLLMIPLMVWAAYHLWKISTEKAPAAAVSSSAIV
ncbi:MAG TPA: prolipoprotein diacylglyceryl transferase [Anaerolineaceae bacterium]|nr:prolipoprotein diacylglyceryl transferase [Anaerolineaceae bacterium]HPN53362.1 prolipoprotein diacylglyceryl transferase [Anaerolineaceae bacterium]